MLLGAIGIPMVLTALLMPAAGKIAHKLRVIDRPSARKLHSKPTPLMGGLALYAAVVIYEASRGAIAPKVMALVAACGVAVLLGALDDRFDIHSRFRLLSHMSLALLLGLAGFRTGLMPRYLDIAFSVIWISGLINAMNCLDCADGVCGGVSGVILACYGAMLVYSGHDHAPLALISLATAGATCGFLLYNFPPAKIFMGDCGSTALGLLIGAISLRAAANSDSRYVLYTALPVILPIGDIIIVHVRRYLSGITSIRDLLASTGKDHLPHRLLSLGLSSRSTAVSVYGLVALFAVVPVFVRISRAPAYLCLAAAIALTASVEWFYVRRSRTTQSEAIIARASQPQYSE